MNSFKKIQFIKHFNSIMHHHGPVNLAPNFGQKIFRIEDRNVINHAKFCLNSSQIIALPTDTVYGLACDASNEIAIKRLYKVKGRNNFKPVAICVKNLNAFRKYSAADHLDDRLLEKLFPGPITIVVHRSIHLNSLLNPNNRKIGIRLPNFDFIRKVCEAYDEPLALTSANHSSEKSSLEIEEFKSLWPDLGAIFDGGHTGDTEEQRLASTVIDLSSAGVYQIIRKGIGYKQTLDAMEMFNIKPLTENIV